MEFVGCNVPVLLIIFNRPENTNAVFNAIRAVKPKQLFIAADGPRESRPEDVEKCNQTRSIIEIVDWDCDVKTLFREKNLGCKFGPSTAIDWFFEHVEYGIILEDDCVPHATFFPYCEELLTKYSDDTRVMMISGVNFLFDKVSIESSYFFSRYHLIWGWATWKRAWKLFDLTMLQYDKIVSERYLNSLFDTKLERNFWRKIYTIAKKDQLQEWDYKWAYSMHVNNALCICPSVNLVQNIGSGIDATHTKSDSHHFNIPFGEIKIPLIHPDVIIRDYLADKILLETFFNVQSVRKKLIKKFLKLLNVNMFCVI
jgi:hypothetical protein